ncbi:hypothetical protein DBR42_19025 [Pelomonas sp. HMWF004]|nr:hypothetical protein DBR42_19025 [Pelomonas sp. HMWF004]
MNTIESNAKLSIELAVADFQSNDSRRTISAMRNITAGILLLFKLKLLELSPADSNEVLIKSKVEPKLRDGKLVFIGKGKNTVDKQEIFERFQSLGISADWKRLNAIVELRNNIEHYRTDVPLSGIREVFGNAFFVINQFCNEALHRKPYDMFGEAVWDVFLEEESFWRALKASVDEANKDVKWEREEMLEVARCFSCSICGSRLLKVVDHTVIYEDLNYQCVACAHVHQFDELIDPALEEAFGAHNYASFKDCGEMYSEECDDCGRASYIVSKAYCAVCGDSPLLACTQCGQQYHPEHYCERCDYINSQAPGATDFESIDDVLSEAGTGANTVNP